MIINMKINIISDRKQQRELEDNKDYKIKINNFIILKKEKRKIGILKLICLLFHK